MGLLRVNCFSEPKRANTKKLFESTIQQEILCIDLLIYLLIWESILSKKRDDRQHLNSFNKCVINMSDGKSKRQKLEMLLTVNFFEKHTFRLLEKIYK